MKCSEVSGQLFFFAEDQENYPNKEVFLQHLAQCQKCALDYNRVLASLQAIKKLKESHVSSNFEQKVFQKLAVQSNNINQINKSITPYFMRIAAIGLLLFSTLSAGLIMGNMYFNTFGKETSAVSKTALNAETDFQLFTDNSFTLIEEAN